MRIIMPSYQIMMNPFMMRMIFGLELKINLISPNMIVHFMPLLPLVFVILTLVRKEKKMIADSPLQKVCPPIWIPTYVVWLMKMIAEGQMRMRRKKEASCISTLA
jgi:hypothetical protein